MINLFGLVARFLLFLVLGGREFPVKLENWLIFWRCLVRRPIRIDLCYFDIGRFVPLVLVEVVWVYGIEWVVVSPIDIGVHVFLDPNDSCSIGWFLLSLSWFCADALYPGLYVPGLTIQHGSTDLI